MFGQSLTSGSITGTVFDPSHAVVPNATVNLKGIDTGSTATDRHERQRRLLVSVF